MAAIGNINNKLAKTFDGKVEARYEDKNCLVLTGELERWVEVVKAGMIAAGMVNKPEILIVNDIICTGDKPVPVRSPRIEDTALEFEECDVLIIGGGVTGCAVARELSQYNLKVLLIEKEADIAMHASGHCAGVVHSGGRLRRGTLKQYYTKLGCEKMEEVCRQLEVPFKSYGHYFLSTHRALKPLVFLSRYYWRFRGHKGAEILSAEELRMREPGIGEKYNSALFFPTGGAVDPQALTVAYAENAMQNGVAIMLDTMAQAMVVDEGLVKSVLTNRGTIHTKVVINAAGVFAEDIAAMADDKFYSVHPVKGATVTIDKKYAGFLAKTLVSTYNKVRGTKKRSAENISNVHRSVDGSIVAGSLYVDTINKEDFTTDRYLIEKTVEQAQQTFPKLEAGQVITYFTGIGAAAYGGDFIVSRGKAAANMIHAAGLQFPGLTAAPAIAEEIGNMVVQMFGVNSVSVKLNYNPRREMPPDLSKMDLAEREQLIADNPDYGVIVCHCENVSRGEIISAINRHVKCDTIDSVGRRTGACCGFCQGADCMPAVMEIISAQKRTQMHHIQKSGTGSEIVFGNPAAIAAYKKEKEEAAEEEAAAQPKVYPSLFEDDDNSDNSSGGDEQ